jgi:hypothetical protein
MVLVKAFNLQVCVRLVFVGTMIYNITEWVAVPVLAGDYRAMREDREVK